MPNAWGDDPPDPFEVPAQLQADHLAFQWVNADDPLVKWELTGWLESSLAGAPVLRMGLKLIQKSQTAAAKGQERARHIATQQREFPLGDPQHGREFGDARYDVLPWVSECPRAWWKRILRWSLRLPDAVVPHLWIVMAFYRIGLTDLIEWAQQHSLTPDEYVGIKRREILALPLAPRADVHPWWHGLEKDS